MAFSCDSGGAKTGDGSSRSRAAETNRNESGMGPQGPAETVFSLYLPSKSEICAQRRVRYRLVPPPFSPRPQFISVPSKTRWCRIRLSERSERVESHSLRHSVSSHSGLALTPSGSARNSRDTAGFWQSGHRVSEPETAGSEPQRRYSPRFLCWQVRRFGFAFYEGFSS